MQEGKGAVSNGMDKQDPHGMHKQRKLQTKQQDFLHVSGPWKNLPGMAPNEAGSSFSY